MEAGMKSLFALAALGCACVFVLPTRAAEGPSRQQVLDLLWHEQFDELEQLTGELRKEKLGFYNGYSKLSTVYGYLDGPGRSAEDRAWQDFLGKLQSWAQARPESATPLIALGDAYIAYAWKARGGGFADTVTEKGWRLFGERLQSARKNLEAAEKMPGKDAEVYRALIVVAMAQGWPRNQMEAVFRKGIEFEPNYQQLYETKAYYLLPRWSGEPGEWETFATEAADARGEEEGDILYMAIARSQAWSEGAQFFRNTRISYERMKRGFEASLRRYPDSVWEMNSYCYFACIARDRAAAKPLFQKINGRWEAEVWRNQNDFRRWQNWALNNGRVPVAATRSRLTRAPFTSGQVTSALLVATAIWLGVVAIIGLVVWLIVRKNRKAPPPLPPRPVQ